MIKVIFMAKETTSSVSALKYLCKKDFDIVAAVIRSTDYKLKEICDSNDILILSEEEIIENRTSNKYECDYLFSFYWKKAKKETIEIPRYGSLNFHPGPLPEARGSGYHVAILENWGYWGVTVHYMDEEFDTGDIIECQHFKIGQEMVNADLVKYTHEQLFLLFKKTVDGILDGKQLLGEKQQEGRYHSIKEIESKKIITKDDTRDEIERKIKAFWNPPYRGAQIEINGELYTVIDDTILQWISKRIIK